MHYLQRLTPRLVPELLPAITEGDTFEILGNAFTVTQVIGDACYVKPAGASWDRYVPTRDLQDLLARVGVAVQQ
jgi:hypothetical protein